jgi:phage shock protein E
MRRIVMTPLAGVAATLLLFTSACSSDPAGVETAAVETVPAERGVELVEQGEHTVIDVRTPAEYAAGHVEGAENIDVSDPAFEQQLDGLDRDGEYVLYCRSGNRSAAAADRMADLGFTEVVDAGGIDSLEAAGASIVQGG